MKKYFLLLIFFSTLFSCKEDKGSIEKNNSQAPLRYTIETARDTFYSNEFVKALVILNKPFFENSKIIVVLEEDENQPLANDLSNEYSIPVQGFHNLEFDTINQKWFEEYNFQKSSVFGKKFQNQGVNKLRGYILEYITNKPPIDSIYDKEKVRKYFFEKSIFIKDTTD